jgi:hypothetical protein
MCEVTHVTVVKVMEFCSKYEVGIGWCSFIYTVISYVLFISIQVGIKKSLKEEEDNDEDADAEHLLEMQTDQDLEDRARKAGVGEEHESSDEELEVIDLYYIT